MAGNKRVNDGADRMREQMEGVRRAGYHFLAVGDDYLYDGEERQPCDQIEDSMSKADKIRRGLDRLIDLMVEDLMEMTDEEILAECIEDGEDPEQIAAEMRTLIREAIKRTKELKP